MEEKGRFTDVTPTIPCYNRYLNMGQTEEERKEDVIKNSFLYPLGVTDSKIRRKLRLYVYFIQSLQIRGSNILF